MDFPFVPPERMPIWIPQKRTFVQPKRQLKLQTHLGFHVYGSGRESWASHLPYLGGQVQSQLTAIGSVRICSRSRVTLQLQLFLRPEGSASQCTKVYMQKINYSTSWRFLVLWVKCNVTLIQSITSNIDCFYHHIYF